MGNCLDGDFFVKFWWKKNFELMLIQVNWKKTYQVTSSNSSSKPSRN